MGWRFTYLGTAITNTLLLDAAVDKLQNAYYNKPTMVSAKSTTFHPTLANPRQSWILNSTPLISDYRYWIPDLLSVKNGFWTPIGSGIPDSLSWIPDSKIQDSEYHNKKKIPGFRIRQATIRFLLESGFSWGESLERFRITITLKLSQSSWQSLKLRTKDLKTPGS